MKKRRNADAELRDAERDWRASGDPRDLVRWKIARRRSGETPYEAEDPCEFVRAFVLARLDRGESFDAILATWDAEIAWWVADGEGIRDAMDTLFCALVGRVREEDAGTRTRRDLPGDGFDWGIATTRLDSDLEAAVAGTNDILSEINERDTFSPLRNMLMTLSATARRMEEAVGQKREWAGQRWVELFHDTDGIWFEPSTGDVIQSNEWPEPDGMLVERGPLALESGVALVTDLERAMDGWEGHPDPLFLAVVLEEYESVGEDGKSQWLDSHAHAAIESVVRYAGLSVEEFVVVTTEENLETGRRGRFRPDRMTRPRTTEERLNLIKKAGAGQIVEENVLWRMTKDFPPIGSVKNIDPDKLLAAGTVARWLKDQVPTEEQVERINDEIAKVARYELLDDVESLQELDKDVKWILQNTEEPDSQDLDTIYYERLRAWGVHASGDPWKDPAEEAK